MRTCLTMVLILIATTFSNLTNAETLQVKVVYAKQETRDLELTLSGNVQALQDAHLTTLQSGVVRTINVDAGDHVEKGQILIELDDSLAQIQLEQAKAEFLSAEVRHKEDVRLYNEIIDLTKKQVVAKTLLEERKSNAAISKAQLAQAKAKVELQKEIVNRHKLVAPFSGAVADRNVDIGEWITTQNKVLQLVSDESLRIFVDVPQEYFNEIKSTASITALVTPDIAPNESISLPLSQFIAVSNPNSRTFKARIDLPSDTSLISGMSATVKLALSSQQNTLVKLPKSALKRHPDGSYSVYSVANSKVKRIGVQLLNSSFDYVAVEGVPDEAAIIISGNELLIDNTPVTVVDSEGGA